PRKSLAERRIERPRHVVSRRMCNCAQYQKLRLALIILDIEFHLFRSLKSARIRKRKSDHFSRHSDRVPVLRNPCSGTLALFTDAGLCKGGVRCVRRPSRDDQKYIQNKQRNRNIVEQRRHAWIAAYLVRGPE